MKNETSYHNLKELVPMVNLKYRQLKTRVKEIHEKYIDRKDLIYKKYNKWFIHPSIVNDFNRIRKPINFRLFITINPEGNYPPSMLKSLIRHIHINLVKDNPLERIKYVLETDNRNILHIHFLTTCNNQRKIKETIKSHILSETQLHIHIKRINNQGEIKYYNEYMRKENTPILLRKSETKCSTLST